nr:uncharacterized protein LOC115259942 [Aedes albopictus]
MTSNKNFRVMGFIYTGLCLTGSFLLIINSSNTVKSNHPFHGESISGVSIVVLLASLVSLIFNALLTFGMLMHRVEFIRYHLRFISTIYVLILVGLFIGCIVGGIALGNSGASDANALGAAAIGMTISVMIGITFVTLQFTLIVWILNGVIRVISNDGMHLVASDAASEMA